MKLIGYPNFYYNGITLHSVEILHLIPRLVMGILAVLDTYLLYKITQIRYDRKVALMAAVLFAVMPTTWILRTGLSRHIVDAVSPLIHFYSRCMLEQQENLYL